MVTKLQTLIDFVLSKENTESGWSTEYVNDISSIRDYANFLNTDMELSMFLPVNEKNIILNPGDIGYEDALEKVIFSNVSYTTIYNDDDNLRLYSVGETQIFNLSLDGMHLYWHIYTIEELANSNDDTILLK